VRCAPATLLSAEVLSAEELLGSWVQQADDPRWLSVCVAGGAWRSPYR